MSARIDESDIHTNASSEEPSSEDNTSVTRRDFVKSAIATGLVVGVGQTGWAAETRQGDMPYRTLGRTGEKVSTIGLGGYHIGVPKEDEEGIRIIRSAI